jgi:hypothetical protein
MKQTEVDRRRAVFCFGAFRKGLLMSLLRGKQTNVTLISEGRLWPILLQKSVGSDRRLAISLGERLALIRQLSRSLRNSNATHVARSGGGRATSGKPQVLSDGCHNKIILGTSWATQPKPTEPEDALQMREPHFDLLALTP